MITVVPSPLPPSLPHTTTFLNLSCIRVFVFFPFPNSSPHPPPVPHTNPFLTPPSKVPCSSNTIIRCPTHGFICLSARKSALTGKSFVPTYRGRPDLQNDTSTAFLAPTVAPQRPAKVRGEPGVCATGSTPRPRSGTGLAARGRRQAVSEGCCERPMAGSER